MYHRIPLLLFRHLLGTQKVMFCACGCAGFTKVTDMWHFCLDKCDQLLCIEICMEAIELLIKPDGIPYTPSFN